MVTEQMLLEKEQKLYKVQDKIDKLVNDDIPDEEQPEIQELQSQINAGFQLLAEMRGQFLDQLEENDESVETPEAHKKKGEYVPEEEKGDSLIGSPQIEAVNEAELKMGNVSIKQDENGELSEVGLEHEVLKVDENTNVNAEFSLSKEEINAKIT